jgi:outer membrane protein OmpU
MKTKEKIMNIKKIGLSALAGSLAMVSANAVELAVSGKSEVTYVTQDGGVTGNPFGMGNSIAFSGSGDVNGMTATYFAAINDNGQSSAVTTEVFASSSLMLDMGDAGTIGFDQGVGEFGVGTIDDKMPYAYEEIWTNTGASNGLRAAGGSNVLGYKNSMSGVNLSVELDPGHSATTGNSGDGASTGAGTTDSGYNFAITSSELAPGVNMGAGFGSESQSGGVNTSDAEYMTGFATYAVGGATVGIQMSEASGGAAGAADNEVLIYGASFSVNENLAISLNQMTNSYKKAGVSADVDAETTGIGASYTMGSAAVRVLASETQNLGGANNTGTPDVEHVEVSLMLAF